MLYLEDNVSVTPHEEHRNAKSDRKMSKRKPSDLITEEFSHVVLVSLNSKNLVADVDEENKDGQ